MNEAAVEAASPETRPCERCGTFAELHSNGFRSLCGPCWALARHPLDARGTSFSDLLRTLGRLLRENWLPAIVLGLMGGGPPALLALTLELPLWFALAWQLVVTTLLEVVLVRIAVERGLAGRTRLDPRLAVHRYLPALLTNALVYVILALATVLLCLPAVFAAALLYAAIPLALFEELPPHRAVAESIRRSLSLVGWLVLFAVVLLATSSLPGLTAGLLAGVNVVRPGTIDPAAFRLADGATWLLGAFLSIPSVLFQVVAWAATRPGADPVVSGRQPLAQPMSQPAAAP